MMKRMCRSTVSGFLLLAAASWAQPAKQADPSPRVLAGASMLAPGGPSVPMGVVDCAGGIIADDGSAENGYGWNPATVTDGRDVHLLTPPFYPFLLTDVCLAWAQLGGDTSINYNLVIYDDDGPGGEPGTQLASIPVTAAGVPGTLPGQFYTYNIIAQNVVIPSGGVYVGAQWNATVEQSFYLISDETGTLNPGWGWANVAPWTALQSFFPAYRALFVRAQGGSASPTIIAGSDQILGQPGAADLCAPTPANQNGTLEPGEQVNMPVEITALGGDFTGINGTLVSNTVGVTVVSGASAYPNLTNGTSGTPVTPFLIYIDETVACGSTIDLELTITAVEGGPFIIPLTGPVGGNPPSPAGLPLAIPDNPAPGVSSTLTVPDSFVLTDVNVSVNITHTWVGDLSFTLTPPGGGPITLLDRPGYTGTGFGCSDNDMNVLFDDSAVVDPETHCAATTPWLTGPVLPFASLAGLNGTNIQGNWVFTVTDNAGGDTGTVVSWNIETTPPLVGTCNVCVGNAPGGGPGPSIVEVPTLSKVGLALLAALLVGAAALLLRRRG